MPGRLMLPTRSRPAEAAPRPAARELAITSVVDYAGVLPAGDPGDG